MKKLIAVVAPVCLVTASFATNIAHDLSASNFSQDWSSTNLITTSDSWSGVPSIMGYRGDGLAGVTGTDPQLVISEGTAVVDVNANQNNPNSFGTGGVTEFDAVANPTIALAGSSTAQAPNIVLYMNAAGRNNVTLSYTLRDLETGADDADQAVALQYRIGNAGNFINVPSAFIADATAGATAGPDTVVTATLAAWDNISDLQLRIITTNAAGNDEWVGIDNITVTSQAVPEPATMTILAGAATIAAFRRRKN